MNTVCPVFKPKFKKNEDNAKFSGNGKRKEFWVFIELYRNIVTVSCVGFDFLSDWKLYTANPQPVVIRFARNKKENLS